ncbi:hypothetical protein E3N88_38637 [Mikania micrantha]|uniref:Uncharacterized protein n=1 Tax=Mikania micrantha TaxID=192012 RepID=A0A5N6LUU3_9ASTR|nr:hypothetical protein E3N88_38637 [Mikania micrantha]
MFTESSTGKGEDRNSRVNGGQIFHDGAFLHAVVGVYYGMDGGAAVDSRRCSDDAMADAQHFIRPKESISGQHEAQ